MTTAFLKEKNKNHIRQSKADRIFDVINYTLLAFILLLVAYPLIFVLSASFSDPLEVAAGNMKLLPVGFNLDGYEKILSYKDIWTGYGNTIFYTVFGTAINMVLTITFAYPLSRRDFKARNILTVMITVTMFFSGGMIPSFLLVKSLNLLDTVWAIVLPGALSTWNVIITRTFFQNSIPLELQEAASIDGCSNTKFLIKVVVPLSMPIFAVIALYYSSAHWNSYFSALIYLSDRAKYPLQLFLRQIFILNDMGSELVSADPEMVLEQQRLAELIKYGIIIVSSVPMLIFYPFLQKYFVKGVMVGSIKG